jgi:hypothetical protein
LPTIGPGAFVSGANAVCWIWTAKTHLQLPHCTDVMPSVSWTCSWARQPGQTTWYQPGGWGIAAIRLGAQLFVIGTDESPPSCRLDGI